MLHIVNITTKVSLGNVRKEHWYFKTEVSNHNFINYASIKNLSGFQFFAVSTPTVNIHVRRVFLFITDICRQFCNF